MTERPIFAIFEGGGAKGVAHVGAFAACEAAGFYFVGVAGASAGAVVATLIAAGFSAGDLLDRNDPQKNLLARYDQSLTSLLGQRDWDRARDYQQIIANAFGRRRLRDWAGLALAAPGIVARLGPAWSRKGFLSTSEAREVLNRVLRDQLTAVRTAAGVTEPLPERITFEHFDYGSFPPLRPLKIIAADVTRRELVIFDRDRTPGMEVALAVTSSIAIPLAFQPVRVPSPEGRPHRHVDGGAVSNLPVWAFANEKLAFERAQPEAGRVPVVGFTLKEREDAPGTPKGDGMWRYLWDGLQTALSGSQSVIQDFMEDLTVVPLVTDLTLFDFGAPPETLLEAYDDGLGCATRELQHHFFDRPRLVREELERIYARVRKALIARRPEGRRRRRILLRANVVERFKGGVFRVTHGFNMSGDADDRLPLDARGRGAPRAWIDRDARLTLVGDAWPHPAEDYMTKYERALANSRIRGIISVPIFADPEVWLIEDPAQRPPPCGVLSIDSDREDELESAFQDNDFMSLFTGQSTLLYPALTREPSGG